MNSAQVPQQTPVPWGVTFSVIVAGIRRRLFRSFITMVSVILAIAFLAYMLVGNAITNALVAADISELNLRLQNAGVDIFVGKETDEMTVMLLSLTLLACLVGIVNAMLMAVTERVKEIGTLKCLGATDRFIIKAYFIESSLQGLMGTSVGLVSGFLVALGVALRSYGGHVFRTFPALNAMQALGTSLLIGLALSVTAAIVPAYMAAKKEPVEALRVEE